MDSKPYKKLITILTGLFLIVSAFMTTSLIILMIDARHQDDVSVSNFSHGGLSILTALESSSHWLLWLNVISVLLIFTLFFFIWQLFLKYKVALSLIDKSPETIGVLNRHSTSPVSYAVTELIQLISESEQNRQKLASILKISGEGFWEWDLRDNSSKIDARCGEILELDPDDFSFNDYYNYIDDKDVPRVAKAIESMCNDGTLFNVEYRMRKPNGEVVWIWDRAQVIERDSDGNALKVVGILLDVTHDKLNQDKIKSLAFYDYLTGLPNRSLLKNNLKQSIQKSTQNQVYSAVLFLDLDRFKILNDTYGHQIGDQLLMVIASRIKGVLKDTDMVARFGGDEFVIILNQVDSDITTATHRVERIVTDVQGSISKQVELRFIETGAVTNYCITTSVGGVLFNSDNNSSDTLLKLADQALYRAKAGGRNDCVLFDPEMQKQQKYIVELNKALLVALRRDQFNLYYQPQYNLNQEVTGVEALIRWSHPDFGLVSPGVFIPLAEESDYIIGIGEWVLSQACQQLEVWQHDPAFSNLQLSINISAKQIWQKDFIAKFKHVISQFSFNYSKLTIEITETILLRDLDDALEKLLKIKEFGCQISLDDFGTGYSSLSYLKNLPIDEMKIDHSFIREIVENHSDLIMVKSIIELGKNFNISIVAEGVETLVQYQLLASFQCPYYQGFYFNHPLPKADFEKYMQDRTRLSASEMLVEPNAAVEFVPTTVID